LGFGDNDSCEVNVDPGDPSVKFYGLGCGVTGRCVAFTKQNLVSTVDYQPLTV